MRSTNSRILVADDNAEVREALRLLLTSEGIDVTSAASPTDILNIVEQVAFDLAILDLNYTRGTSGEEGFAILDRLRILDPTLPVIVMTGWSTVAGAVEAMRRGAQDYIEKPWEDERLLASIRSHLALKRALVTGRRLQEVNERLQGRDHSAFIADAPSMKKVLYTIDRVADSDAAVLITGEHGTGKEVVATQVHKRSARASKSFVTVNAGGLAQGIAESELFGHVKGAFTDARSDRIGCFELATDGTLFLDEIANMPTALQAKVLRVLQTGEFQRVGSSRTIYTNTRVISATNADLSSDISRGTFREDLLYRLNTVVIHLPPLRDRRHDILLLAGFYLTKYSAKYRRSVTGFDSGARALLEEYSWPGNVRELNHAVERAVLMATASEIGAAHLGLEPKLRTEAGTLGDELTLDDAEKLFVKKVLARHGGDVRKTAVQLRISRSALYRRIQQWGLGSD